MDNLNLEVVRHGVFLHVEYVQCVPLEKVC